MKFFIPIFFISNFFIIRLLSAHHCNSVFKSYYKIKHPLLGRMLIGKFPFTGKIDKSKLSAQGIFLHIISIIALIFCIYMLFICPVINKEVIVHHGIIHHGRRSMPFVVSTLNEACVFFACFIVLAIEMMLILLESIKTIYNATDLPTGNSIVYMLGYFVSLFALMCVFLGLIGFILSFFNIDFGTIFLCLAGAFSLGISYGFISNKFVKKKSSAESWRIMLLFLWAIVLVIVLLTDNLSNSNMWKLFSVALGIFGNIFLKLFKRI